MRLLRAPPRLLRMLSIIIISFGLVTWLVVTSGKSMSSKHAMPTRRQLDTIELRPLDKDTSQTGDASFDKNQVIQSRDVDSAYEQEPRESPAQSNGSSPYSDKAKFQPRRPLAAKQAKPKRVDPWAELRVKHWSRQQTLDLIKNAAGYTQQLTPEMAPVRTSEERQRLCDKYKEDTNGVYPLRELLEGGPDEYDCQLAISGNLCRKTPSNVLLNKRSDPSKPRVMCWLLGSIKDTRKEAVRDTWGARCDFMVYTAAEDSDFPTLGLPVPDGRDHIAAKAVSMWVYIYLHFLHEFDFFYKGDPDTFAVIPNIKRFVKDKDPELPLYYGNQFHIQDIPWWKYNSGGPGELLSRGAVRVLVEHSYRTHCHKCIPDGQCEDCKLARCFYMAGVNASDSRDSQGREHFLPEAPWKHIVAPPKPGMYDGYNLFGTHYGHNCCAEYPISFHYVKPTEMYMLEYFFHRWKVAPYDEPSFDSYKPLPTGLPQMGQAKTKN